VTYCAFEPGDFPDTEFERDAEGVLWHKGVSPRHTTLGEIENPEPIPGMEEADAPTSMA
jgi:hypothetical protein